MEKKNQKNEIEEKYNNDLQIDINLYKWYIGLKKDQLKDITLKDCMKKLKDVKQSISRRAYFKIFVEIIQKQIIIFNEENLKEYLEYFKDQMDYITDYGFDIESKKNIEFPIDCRILIFNLASKVKHFDIFKEDNYIEKLFNLILIYIPSLFSKQKYLDESNANILIKCLHSINKMYIIYSPESIYLINYLNELAILACYKFFKEETIFKPNIIYYLCLLFQIQLCSDGKINKNWKDLKLKNINLCLLYLIYSFILTQNELKDFQINLKNENGVKNKISLKDSIEELILKCFSSHPKLINNFLDIISDDFFNKISQEKEYTSYNYINFILSLNNNERNELNFTKDNKEMMILTSYKENLYKFILSKDFGELHLNIKEMIIIGLLNLYKIFPLYSNKDKKNFNIPYTILFNKIKNVLKDENSIFNDHIYPYIFIFLSNLIENYTKELKDSWNEIIDILIILYDKIKNEKDKEDINNILNKMINLILFEEIPIDCKNFLKLCEKVNSDSIILNSFICNIKMSNNNPNYKEDTMNFFQKYIFENEKNKNNLCLLQSNFCMVLDKIKYNIRFQQNQIKKDNEEILNESISNIINYGINKFNLNEYISFFIIECILCMDYSDNYINIINKLFYEYQNEKKTFSFSEKTLFNIFWVLNYSCQKEKIEKFLELLLNGNNFDKNISMIETILLNIIVTQDGLIHIINDNKYLIEFQYSPVPILISHFDNNEYNKVFILFDIKNILSMYFKKKYYIIDNIVYQMILRNVENALTLNKDSIYFIYTIFINSQTLLKKFQTNEEKILLEIFLNLNYYFSWSNKYFIGKKEEINLYLYSNEIESSKDTLFQSIFQKMKSNLNLEYFLPIFQFYTNTLFESSIDEMSNYSNSPQINDIMNFLSNLYYNYQNNICILMNILNCFTFFQEIIRNSDISIENKVILILCLIAFPENKNYFVEKFKTELITILPNEEFKNYSKQNNEEINEDKNEYLFIIDYAKNLLFIYFSFSRVKNELINFFKNIPKKNNINEFNYFYKMSKLELELNIKKRNTCSLKRMEDILSNKNENGKYILINNSLFITYPENDNKLTLIILNQYSNFEYTIEIPKSDSNFLSEKEQINKLNKIINNKDIKENENNNTYSESKYINQPQNMLFNKENISNIILQFISDIPINEKLSKIEQIKNINNENINQIKNILKNSIYKICNVNIIYNPYSFYPKINEKELYDKNKDNFSKEFLEFLSKIGDLQINKNTGEISLYYEDFVNQVNLFLYDSINDNEKRKSIFLTSQIEIIWMDYPNQSINEYLEKVNQSTNKIYIFVFPNAKNLYKVELRVRTILNQKDEKKKRSFYSRNQILSEKIELSQTQKNFIDFKYIEEYLDDFIQHYFLKNFMVNMNSPSGIRYFKNLIILLNSRINYIKEKLQSQPFISIEEKIINQILQLEKK